MFGSRVTVIEGHNKFQTTDQLYDPLRKTFMLDTTARKTELEEISRYSHVSHQVKTHTAIENIEIAEHTFIPEDAKLRPTHNYWKVPKDHQYYIVNAEYKVYDPISEEEMERVLQYQRSQDEVIVYEIDEKEEYDEEQLFVNRKLLINQEHQVSASNYDPNFQLNPMDSYRFKKEQDITQIPTDRQVHNEEVSHHSPILQRQTYLSDYQSGRKATASKRKDYSKEITRKGSGISVTQPKYNFFSALDEPLNNLITGKSCTCPANEIVADQINEISWYGTNMR